ncbi:MAG: glycosyltransferase [Leeuwenhoekiella sp.]
MKQQKLNIAILVEILGNGGAERSAGIISQILTDLGHSVHMVTVTDVVEYEYSGKLLNLGIYKNQNNSIFNKWKRLFILKDYLKNNQVDLIIDFRFRQNLIKEVCISLLLYRNLKVVYAVHSYNIAYYFPQNKKLVKLLFNKRAYIYTLTEGIKKRIIKEYALPRIVVIPNGFDLEQFAAEKGNLLKIDPPFILAVGRMNVKIKQFDELIETYAKSDLPGKGVDLRILGDGKLMQHYQEFAKKHGVEHSVYFEGFVEKPQSFYRQALFLVQCSKFEGFPMVILESLACGTPVIAMDCPTGPGELISERNGILIENQNFDALREAMNSLIADENRLAFLKSNSVESIEKYDIVPIAEKWKDFLNNIYGETKTD